MNDCVHPDHTVVSTGAFTASYVVDGNTVNVDTTCESNGWMVGQAPFFEHTERGVCMVSEQRIISCLLAGDCCQ